MITCLPGPEGGLGRDTGLLSVDICLTNWENAVDEAAAQTVTRDAPAAIEEATRFMLDAEATATQLASEGAIE